MNTNLPEKILSLQKKMSTCTACPLAECGRTQVVHGKGNFKPDFFLIGEAPGAQEDLEGRPFVGRSGQLLRATLKKLLPPETTYYVSNTVKCRPTANRTPTPEERATCSKIGILQEIKLIEPTILVTVGAVALSVLIPSFGSLSASRQKVFSYDNVPLVPILHPAYCLRFPSKKSDFEKDILFALSTLKTIKKN